MPKGAMKKVDPARFSMVPRPDVPRSAFDVQHFHKTTMPADVLIPAYVEEVLPGDSIRLKMSAFARLATAIVPPMDNLVFESFFFFVPNRLVWEHWENLMGEKDSPTDTTAYLTPYVNLDTVGPGQLTIYDYFGLTTNGVAPTEFRPISLPLRGYNLIWNEWFRDQDLQAPAPVPTGDGPDAPLDFATKIRGKRHDYFTSARPLPYKPTNQSSWSAFDPLGPGGNFIFRPGSAQGAAPVTGLGYLDAQTTTAGPITVKYPGGRTLSGVDPYFQQTGIRAQASGTDGWPDIKVLVSDIRSAILIQQMLERDARGGTRYTEVLRAHFGVTPQDARLQRPEYLGGGRTYINIHPLAQTSATEVTGSTTLLGEQAGIGTAQVYDHGFSQSFAEHGFIIGLINVRADLTYQQGIERFWGRRSRFQYYWPGLNGLSEQAIQSREIYCDGSSDDLSTFGYQERWAEYKTKPSRVSGAFRSQFTAPLDMWHFAQYFSSRPLLNATFIQSDTPVDRVLQDTIYGGQAFLVDCLFDARMVRAMPMYSLPGMGARL